MTAEIGPWSAADAEPLFEIYRRIFGDQKAEARRSSCGVAVQEDNPESSGQPVVWVARRNGRAVGQVGSMPVCMWWGDREIRASWGLDYFVAPEAEGLGDSISAHAGVDAEGRSRARARPRPDQLPHLQAARLPRPRIRAALPGGVGPGSHRAAPVGQGRGRCRGAVLERVDVGRASPTRARFPEIRRWLPAGEIRRRDYDELWQRARTGFAMCVRRDAAYVRWRYQRAPNRRYDILEARRAGELAGFAVSRHGRLPEASVWAGSSISSRRQDDGGHTRRTNRERDERLHAGGRRASAGLLHLPAARRRSATSPLLQRRLDDAHLVARPNGVSEAPILEAGDWHVVHGDSDSDR